MKEIEDHAATPAVPPPVPEPKKTNFRNSLWCVDKAGHVGMIDELRGDAALFRYEGEKGLGDTTPVPLSDLAIAPAAMVPARLGYTPEQLRDLGHE
jgi:hypothetical protein